MSDILSESLKGTVGGLGRAKRRILVISYLFPPAGGISVQRALSLAKYLPNFGFEVHVLRAGNAAAPVYDPALCRQIPAGVTVHSAFAPEIPFNLRHAIWGWLSRRSTSSGQNIQSSETRLSGRGPRAWVVGMVRRLLCPEPEVLWYPFAFREARRIVQRHNIDSVMVTAPPFSAFLVGNALKRRFPGLRYVADFRDEWISFYLKDFEFQSGEYTRRRAIEIERETIKCADLVVAVTESSLDEIRRRYPTEPPEKFACVSNGFDPDVFKDYRPQPNIDEKLVVTHVGTVYKTASPKFYLDALDELPEEMRLRIETRFIGRISDSEKSELEGRKSAVRVFGFMPQQQALRHMQETDCLLVTMMNEISLPGKIYEYLAASKPILGLTPRGSELDRFLVETDAGWSVDYREKETIKGLLKVLLEQKITSRQIENRIAAESVVRSYERPQLAERYARMIFGAKVGQR